MAPSRSAPHADSNHIPPSPGVRFRRTARMSTGGMVPDWQLAHRSDLVNSVANQHQRLTQDYDEALRPHLRPVDLRPQSVNNAINNYNSQHYSAATTAQDWDQINDLLILGFAGDIPVGVEDADITVDQRDGLTELVIPNYLKTRICAADDGGKESDGICVVCLDDLCQTDWILGSLHCGHEYHVNCITKWLQLKNVCPLCSCVALPIVVDKQES